MSLIDNFMIFTTLKSGDILTLIGVSDLIKKVTITALLRPNNSLMQSA
jgi:hypothetical protein